MIRINKIDVFRFPNFPSFCWGYQVVLKVYSPGGGFFSCRAISHVASDIMFFDMFLYNVGKTPP